MHIFNSGKYKSLHAQAEGELAAVAARVAEDHHFRPTYHLAPPTGLLNDPNGLIFDGEKYHIFYQWFPYDALHGMKHWKHFITRDFVTYLEADPLIPDELFESHGCYSGGAILWQDKIVAFYTGNTRRASDNQRIPHQNIAIFDKSGKLLEKRCIMDCAPEGYTEHCRDPKPFVTAEGKIRFVLGVQRANLSGAALLFEMDDLDSTPRNLGEIEVEHFDNQNVFMWECPDLFSLGDHDLFVWSPQGKLREKTRFQNNYHATYALGKLNGNTLQATHFEELDYGFDFYAPQTVQNAEGIMFGWVGLPDLTYPTDAFKWHSTLSMPRRLSVKNGKIVQQPIVQKGEVQTLTVQGKTPIADLDTAYVQISLQNQPLALRLFDNAQGQHLALRYANGIFALDRSHSEQTALMADFGTERHCEITDLHTVELYFDRSVLEIYLNGGEKVLTSRFFIAERENCLYSDTLLNIQTAKVGAHQYQ